MSNSSSPAVPCHILFDEGIPQALDVVAIITDEGAHAIGAVVISNGKPRTYWDFEMPDIGARLRYGNAPADA